MGLRFRKSVKLCKGLRLNFNKNSTSLTFGGKGLHYTINSKGRKTKTVGIPGTGLSYTSVTQASTGSSTPNKQPSYSPPSSQNNGFQSGPQGEDPNKKSTKTLILHILQWLLTAFFLLCITPHGILANILFVVCAVAVNPLFLKRVPMKKRFLIPGVFILFFIGCVVTPPANPTADTAVEDVPAVTQTQDEDTSNETSVLDDTADAAVDTDESAESDNSSVQSDEPEQLSDNQLMNAEVLETSLANGFGEEIDGTRGYIEFDKDSAQNDVSEKDFVEFYKTVVKDSDLNYFTIDFSDGTGIVFIPGIRSAEYCEIDDTGSNINAIGYITWKKNKVTYQTVEEFEAEEAAEAAAAAAEEEKEQYVEELEEEPKETVVYITNTGAKYHNGGCRTLKDSKIETTLSSAKAQGYEPCGICHPPTE